MKVTEFAVNRPVSTAMLFLAFVIFGLLSYSKLSVNLMPALDLPAFAISTDYYGANPEEIEKEVTELIENELSSLSGLKLLQSYSMSHSSLVFVQFNQGKNQDQALNEVKAKLDQAIPRLPTKATRPLVESFDFKDSPVVDLVVLGDGNASQLYDYAKRVIKDQLSRVDGVSKVNISGGELREVRVLADKRSMYNMQMNLSDLSHYLEAANSRLSAGDFTDEDQQFSVETSHVYDDVDKIRNTHIPTSIGIQRLVDLAQVIDTVADMKFSAVYTDGVNQHSYANIVSISVLKDSDANAVSVAREVKEVIQDLRNTLPEGVDVKIPFDSSKYIDSAVSDALLNVGLGILFTGLILFFFLNDLRTTLIVSISVPVSLIGTFVAIQYIDGSLNMMTLMSYAVAIGALISNSIVVIENIVRLKKEGMEIKAAAIQGTREVMMAVIASTGTNLVVFLPIANMTSITGAFFKEYALTISAATIASLIISFMLTPMLASIILKKDLKPTVYSRAVDRFFVWLENQYERSLEVLISRQKNPILLFSVMFAFFMLSTGLLPQIGFEFEPQEDDGSVYVEVEMPSGTSMAKSTELMSLVDQTISRHPEVKATVTVVGSKNSYTTGTNYANCTIKLIDKAQRELSNVEFAEKLGWELNDIPEIMAWVSNASSEDGAPIQFNIFGNDPQDLMLANELIMEKLKSVDGLLSLQSNAKKGSPIIRLEPNQRKLAELHLSPFQLAATVRNAINGIKSTVLKENGKEYDVRISYPEEQINSILAIEQIPITTPTGTFTVGELVNVSHKTSQAQILHVDKSQVVEFSITPAPGVVSGDAEKEIRRAINELELPNGVKWKWAGDVEELNETLDDMYITFTLALMLMYMLLASLLENHWHPVIIFSTVPMAMIGVFAFMYLGGQTMNIMSLMAIVTLLGLVVNDDILIHDYTQQLINRHQMDLKKATLLGAKRKMKTVIMTTVAIIAGMLPNALGIGDAGAEYRTPLAVVTIGGMVTSTILTLYLIPSIFYIIKAKKRA